MSGPGPGWADGTGRDEVGESIVRLIEARQPRHGTAVVGDDHLLTGPDAAQVAAEVVLQVPDTDLDA